MSECYRPLRRRQRRRAGNGTAPIRPFPAIPLVTQAGERTREDAALTVARPRVHSPARSRRMRSIATRCGPNQGGSMPAIRRTAPPGVPLELFVAGTRNPGRAVLPRRLGKGDNIGECYSLVFQKTGQPLPALRATQPGTYGVGRLSPVPSLPRTRTAYPAGRAMGTRPAPSADDEQLAGLLVRMWSLASGRRPRPGVRPDELTEDELIAFWADDLTPVSGRHAACQPVPAGERP